MSDLHDKAKGLAAALAIYDGDHHSASIIRALLAEVERLTLTASEHRDGRLAALERATVAEARLRELASAEPVAWVDGEYFVWPKGKRRPSNCDALIRRPEMPS